MRIISGESPRERSGKGRKYVESVKSESMSSPVAL